MKRHLLFILFGFLSILDKPLFSREHIKTELDGTTPETSHNNDSGAIPTARYGAPQKSEAAFTEAEVAQINNQIANLTATVGYFRDLPEAAQRSAAENIMRFNLLYGRVRGNPSELERNQDQLTQLAAEITKTMGAAISARWTRSLPFGTLDATQQRLLTQAILAQQSGEERARNENPAKNLVNQNTESARQTLADRFSRDLLARNFYNVLNNFYSGNPEAQAKAPTQALLLAEEYRKARPEDRGQVLQRELGPSVPQTPKGLSWLSETARGQLLNLKNETNSYIPNAIESLRASASERAQQLRFSQSSSAGGYQPQSQSQGAISSHLSMSPGLSSSSTSSNSSGGNRWRLTSPATTYQPQFYGNTEPSYRLLPQQSQTNLTRSGSLFPSRTWGRRRLLRFR